MIKRATLVLAIAAAFSTTFVGCKKAEVQPEPAPAEPAVEAPAADASATAPAAQPGEPAPAPIPSVPPEAQAAMDNLLSVMSSIAEAAKKDTCAEVLAELKALNNDDTKSKLLSSRILQNYPPETQESINEANKSRLIGVAFEMAAFKKCESSPENDAIGQAIDDILAPISPAAEPDGVQEAPADSAAAPAAGPDGVQEAADATKAAADTADAAKAAIRAAAENPSEENIAAAKAAALDAAKTADAAKVDAAKAAADAAVNSADADKVEAAKAAAKAAGLAE